MCGIYLYLLLHMYLHVHIRVCTCMHSDTCRFLLSSIRLPTLDTLRHSTVVVEEYYSHSTAIRIAHCTVLPHLLQ